MQRQVFSLRSFVLKPPRLLFFSRSIDSIGLGVIFLAAAFSVLHINQQHVQRRPRYYTTSSILPDTIQNMILSCKFLFLYFYLSAESKFCNNNVILSGSYGIISYNIMKLLNYDKKENLWQYFIWTIFYFDDK